MEPAPGLESRRDSVADSVEVDEPGDIQIYGYHDEVLLMQEITPPAKIAENRRSSPPKPTGWFAKGLHSRKRESAAQSPVGIGRSGEPGTFREIPRATSKAAA